MKRRYASYDTLCICFLRIHCSGYGLVASGFVQTCSLDLNLFGLMERFTRDEQIQDSIIELGLDLIQLTSGRQVNGPRESKYAKK